MAGRMSGKVAIVTGGAQGMGRSHALLLAAEGAEVVVTDVREAAGKSSCRGDQRRRRFRHASSRMMSPSRPTGSACWKKPLTNSASWTSLVNNAGILILKPLDETDEEEWDRTLDINAKGTFLGWQAGGACASGRRRRVHCRTFPPSMGSLERQVRRRTQASKGAVRLLTKAAAVDIAKYGIRVNWVHPGVIDTEMTKELMSTPEGTKAVLGTTILGRPGRPRKSSTPFSSWPRTNRYSSPERNLWLTAATPRSDSRVSPVPAQCFKVEH